MRSCGVRAYLVLFAVRHLPFWKLARLCGFGGPLKQGRAAVGVVENKGRIISAHRVVSGHARSGCNATKGWAAPAAPEQVDVHVHPAVGVVLRGCAGRDNGGREDWDACLIRGSSRLLGVVAGRRG